jgi:hypothetical protein
MYRTKARVWKALTFFRWCVRHHLMPKKQITTISFNGACGDRSTEGAHIRHLTVVSQ